MRSAALLAFAALAWAGAALAQTPIAAPTGFVNDRAGVIDASNEARLTALLQELQQKTGAEIAVLTVDTTAPLDDFSYAMQVAEQWKVGKKGEDTGIVVLLAVRDRKSRVVVGYGLEGILPDGLVGAIQKQEMVPEFRQGRYGDGLWRGVGAMANRIAADRGVTLTGAPAPRADRRPEAQRIPGWVVLLLIFALLLVATQSGTVMSGARRGRRRRGGGPIFFPGGFGGGGGGGFGGFGGGGGGFGGFGGGDFGGGGAGADW